MKKTDSTSHNKYLLILLLLFSFRVGAQLLQAYYPVGILPPFEAWQSGALPYSLLIISQILIIVILVRIVWRLHNGRVQSSHKLGKLILILGGLYFSIMLFRLISGLTFASDHSWFGAIIPTIFHLVLASFALTYGHYHYKYGAKSHV